MIRNWNKCLALVVEKQLKELLEKRNEKYTFLVEAARATGGLPVYCDMGGCLTITTERQIVAYDFETQVIEAVIDEKSQRLALITAGENYKELESLLPSKPPGAKKCTECDGTGLVFYGKIRCAACCGAGWE